MMMRSGCTYTPTFKIRCIISKNFLNMQIMCYVIYDIKAKKYVSKRKNVLYPLFCDFLHEARFYKSYKYASTLVKQISRIHGIYTLRIVFLPSYSCSL